MNIADILGYIDSLKRQYGGTLSDIAADPRKGLLGVGDRLNQGAREWNRDMMGQMGGLLSVRPEVQEQSMEGLLGTLPMPAGINAIRAFHGSPHKFDKFDLSKMGTGEGAQAYGWGGYVAESPGTANYYKVADENVFPTIRKGDSRLDLALRESTDIADNKIYSAISQNVRRSTVLDDKTLAQVKKQIQHDADYFAGSPAGTAADAALQKYDNVAAQLKGAQFDYDPGNLYELDLRWPDAAREAADPMGPQHFLDWDKPLSQQPENVRKMVSIDNVGNKYGGYSAKVNGREIMDPVPSQKEAEEWLSNAGFNGEDIYRWMMRDEAQRLKSDSGAMKNASEYLKAQGIPGIRYLDAGSRGPAGNGRWKLTFKDGRTETFNFKPNDDVLDMMGAKAEPIGTANYVVFDDAIIELLKRNGIPIPKPQQKGIPTGLKSAAVKVGDQTFLGATHGQAINRALYEGAVRKVGGKFVPNDPNARIDWDLFLTNDDQLIDRLTAYSLFEKSAGAAETSLERGLLKQQPARKFSGDGSLSGELSNLLYGP